MQAMPKAARPSVPGMRRRHLNGHPLMASMVPAWPQPGTDFLLPVESAVSLLSRLGSNGERKSAALSPGVHLEHPSHVGATPHGEKQWHVAE